MPQFLMFTAVGLGLTVAWRLVRREMDRVEASLETVRAPRPTNVAPRLVLGADGVYRPEPRDMRHG